ncbi:peptidylprolyl isomerase [Paenibacillus validus]|uniref:PPIase cyclophilin-type domain-containing protein n=1 Tax=Paenibacillus validus TaxID=44253 RepID=A0A7X2ZEX1_9BACL|nr:peptidylprolyl isomerase [Paenibacillus validus]MED4600925.1 peptidylprolyl isomerase [Paenibacillus validus]MED4607219.1 peptidylprolyl isomerase [Paenibacillus validus]MUG73663.1 hypothetical protein [Paenibacillus validus]
MKQNTHLHKYHGLLNVNKTLGPEASLLNYQDSIMMTKDEASLMLNQMPNYTIFGKVTSGMDTVLKIAETRVSRSNLTSESSQPTENVIIQSVEIIEKDI